MACLTDTEVRSGFFPEALGAGEQFDVIVFNDVFEHISDPNSLLDAVRLHLAPRGLVLLNLPSSRGVFYRFARWLAGVGMPGNFERLWQKGMPSPHLHYFHNRNLVSLLAKTGFRILSSGTLPSVLSTGLWSRISYDQRGGHVGQVLIWLGVLLAFPVIRLLPADIMYVLASPLPEVESASCALTRVGQEP